MLSITESAKLMSQNSNANRTLSQKGEPQFRGEDFMKNLMMVLALTLGSMPLASAREQNDTFLIRHEARRLELAKKANVQPMQETVPEQACAEEKTSGEKC